MKGAGRKTLIVAVLSMLLYVGFAIYADIESLGAHLRNYAWWTFAAALLLACLNYVIRAVRWHQYLRCLDMHVPVGDSGLIFVSGFALSATPGKVGEVLKSFLLKDRYDIPVARSAPIVVAERLTDFLGLSILALLGVLAFDFHTLSLLITIGAVVTGTLLLANRSLVMWGLNVVRKVPSLRGIADKIEGLIDTVQALLRPGILLSATALSVLGWACECVGFYLIIKGLGVEQVTVLHAIFIHAAASILGAVSMLPGGVGLTEALMVSGLMILVGVPEEATAVAATLLNRLATLWWAVALGFVALALRERLYGTKHTGTVQTQTPETSA